LEAFRAFIRQRGFDLDAVERATADKQSAFSIHDSQAIKFMSEVVGASSKVQDILRFGLRFEFSRQPGEYQEVNNKSAQAHMDTVRSKVAEWESGGFVETRKTRSASLVLQPIISSCKI